MKEHRFYLCKHCGNLIGMIHDSGAHPVCCGEPMMELVADSVDASHEKHVPVAKVDGDLVTIEVGSAAHPMIPEHFIEWIFVQTERGGQRKMLKPGEAPRAEFLLKDDKPLYAFAYCNLHGLWKTNI